MAEPKSKRTRQVSELQEPGEAGILIHLPDKTSKRFRNADEAQQWFDSVYSGDRYSLTRTKAAQESRSKQSGASTKQPHFASEDLPVYTSRRTGIDKYAGSASPSPVFRETYDRIGMNPITSDVRVENMTRAWRNNPKAMQLWTDAGNEAGAFVTAPFAIGTAPAWAPHVGNAVLQGLKWRYTTPSGWILGSAAELPNLAQAADNEAQGDDRSRIRRIWDYAWDNPGKTFMTLAGLQATYNWANNKWGTPPEWKYGNVDSDSKALVPYNKDYANKTKSLPRRLVKYGKGFVKQNWLSVPAAIYGAWKFGDWLLSNPDQPQSTTVNNQNQSDSIQENALPTGFRPIVGYSEENPNRVVTYSSSGRPDSIVPIQEDPDISRFSK